MQTNTSLPRREKPVTAIIPAFNEAQHISRVLEVLGQVDVLSEIIVVDDCSKDATADIVRSYCQIDRRIHLVSLHLNQGKGGAMVAGAQTSKNDLIVFLDADLINLQPEHVLSLITPVRSGDCSMSLGIFKGGRFQTDWSHRLTPFLSGQRCLRWSLFQHTPEIASSRWEVEVALSLFARQNRLSVQIVPWLGVTHVMRPEKLSGLEGYLSHFHMWADIGKYLLCQLTASKEPSINKLWKLIS